MANEVRPVGVGCNLRCDYCYEFPLREEQAVHRYDREKVLAAIDKLGAGPDQFFSLFGGEPMILAFHHFEELLSIAHTRWGHSGLQTNGSLITEKYIDLFTKYKTHVGISLDGPDELNDSRWAGNLEATRKATAQTLWAIDTLAARSKEKDHAHLLPSIIVTLHSGNCSKEHFPKLVEWFKHLNDIGIRSVNLHVMEMDAHAGKWAMDPDELSDRLIDLWNLHDTFKTLKFLKFVEVLKLLQGDDDVVCVWHTCDPWNTSAVQGIENDGAPSHCSRTNKDGKNWLPAEGFGAKGQHNTVKFYTSARSHERQMALYVTPQEVGGCKDCEYWMMCYGQCPGTGENNDWRERTTYCSLFKKLFAEGAKRLRAVGVQPLPDWQHRKELEAKMYDYWIREQTVTTGALVREMKEYAKKGMHPVANGWHGDHTDA
jgi:uncharacterized protein